MNNKKLQLIFGSILVVLGIGYLVYAAFQGATVYYLTVEEFLAQQATLSGEGFRIAGTVAPGSIQRSPTSSEITFVLRGNTENARLPVYYKGTVPDIFRDDASVVLEGKYRPEEQRFYAVTLMTTCPSKYESKLKDQK